MKCIFSVKKQGQETRIMRSSCTPHSFSISVPLDSVLVVLTEKMRAFHPGEPLALAAANSLARGARAAQHSLCKDQRTTPADEVPIFTALLNKIFSSSGSLSAPGTSTQT